MLQQPTDGETVFEVSIYNKEVRSLVKDNQSHDRFDDQWADVRVHDVVAQSEDDARRMVSEQYSPDDGFVIADIVQTEDVSVEV